MKKKVIIVGAGFGGLTAAKQFDASTFEVTVVDKTNHHLFQPLLYQVATSVLSPGDIAIPIRSILSGYKNVNVIMREVTGVDISNRRVLLSDRELDYDYLILAPGSRHSYLGNDHWEKKAPGLKILADALRIRERILQCLENAEASLDQVEKLKNLTFVIVGGGPTGVEMAGAIAEMAKKDLIRDFRNIQPSETKVILLEGQSRVLSAFSERLSSEALKELEKMGVDVRLKTNVEDISEAGVKTSTGMIETSTIVWAAGNKVAEVIDKIDCEKDRAGRVKVNQDLSIEGYKEVFIIGDAAFFKDRRYGVLPGIAPVAMQQGKFAAKQIANDIEKIPREEFRYFDKGSMATIGRAKAVANIWGMEFSGFFAWILWSFVHVMFLIGFRNRIRVMAEWIWYYLTFKHGIRIITKRK
ncbi:MAG: NAD(P)/FAD-dependent oxidoreductase [Ignavibacteriaceae bacterium]|nr:NAD(P)/FAD-dependent oxidoreductase [Ignavibacteriaceae bacterium]